MAIVCYRKDMKKGSSRYVVLEIERLPEGYYVATSPDVQGLVAQAKTFEKTVEIAHDLAATLLREQKKGKVAPRGDKIIYPMMVTA